MFIGHFALAFAAKRAAPRQPLPLLILAAQLADTLWPVFLAIGLEHVRIDPGNTAFTPLDFVSYPYSHSLLLLTIWGVALGIAGRKTTKNSRAFSVLLFLVISHWVLDWLTHRPDMPLFPGGPKHGLGLWNSVLWTIIVEVTLYVAGVWIYVSSTRARDAIGRWALLGLVVFLPIVYFGNVIGGAPPSVTAIWVSAIIGVIIILAWSWWIDRHRTPRNLQFGMRN